MKYKKAKILEYTNKTVCNAPKRDKLRKRQLEKITKITIFLLVYTTNTFDVAPNKDRKS